MLGIRLDGDLDVEGIVIRKNFHEARRLYDGLCRCNLSRGSEQSADESGSGEHGDNVCCLVLVGRFCERERERERDKIKCAYFEQKMEC